MWNLILFFFLFKAFVISRGKLTRDLLLILVVLRRCPSTQAVTETRRSMKQSWLLGCIPTSSLWSQVAPTGTCPAVDGQVRGCSSTHPTQLVKRGLVQLHTLPSVLLLPER